MVMKKDGRKRDIKSKLVAAVCMLLVSCIMMVSSTYAWFTLSTAPEVKGISTSVGSNGNLEIALSPKDGDGTKVGDYTIGADANDWVAKNLTWGNLLDLSDESYGFQNWTLSPSQLLLSGGKLGTNPLAIPEYGSDGRITALNKTDVTIDTGDMGVRPVGSASGLSAQQAQLKASLADIITYANKATDAASKSLNENGQALASIMVQHAKAGEADGNNYGSYVADLQKLTAALDESVSYMKEAVRSALIVAACAKTYESDAAFETAVEAIKSANIDSLIADAGAEASAAYAAIGTVAGDVSAAQSAAASLSADSASWTQISGVVSKLMNTAGVEISGYSIADIKEKMEDMNFLLGLATNTRIELGAGSGVYYDIAEIAGNITASTTATVNAGEPYGSVTLKNVIITTKFTGVAQLTALHTAIKGTQAPATEGGSAVIDTFYGYVIDFMFRTNAADSNLLLQTDGAQRVYDDSTNTATQGAGSTFTFTTTNEKQVATLKGMVQALRVVFFEPSTGKILGVAKATSVTATEEGGTYTITGYLVLCNYTVTDDLVTVDEAKVDDVNTDGVDESVVLTTLGQNVATAVSAMVYLDGSNLTNADMLTSGEVGGKLNLQFASDANLVPMNNNDLYQGTTPANP